MGIRTRLATPLDAAALGEIDPAASRAGAPLGRAVLVGDALHGGSDALCLVAQIGEGAGPAGFVVLRHGRFFDRDLVDLLVVAPPARRQGVGSALLAGAVAAAASDRVFTAVRRADLPARALLAGLGWEVSGRFGGLDGPDPDDDRIVSWTPGPGAPRPGGPERGPRRLFHVALREDWDRACRTGEYRVSTIGHTLDEVGFVHASFAQQVEATVRRHYAGVAAPLVLLVVDRGRLGPVVRVEPAPGADEVFPHVYGPVPVDAVAHAVELPRDVTGRPVLPAL